MGEGRRPLYAHQGVGQFSHGLAGPFVPYYATRLGATTADLGWLQAFSNLFPNLLQAPWGRLSDRVGRRVPFIVLGTVLSTSLFLLMAASASPWQLILLVLVQAIALSMVVPNWSALLGERTGRNGRGLVFGRISQVAGLASLAGTLLAAVIVFQAPPTEAHAFQVPFVVAAVVGIASGLVLIVVKEDPKRLVEANDANGGNDAERRADFVYFTKAQGTYNFFMSVAWPLMPITVARVLGASNLDIVMITVVSTVSTIVLQTQVGKLLDRVGPVALIQASRFLFLLVPLAYGFANDLVWIYLISVLMGIPTAIVNVSFNAYILDIAPPARRAQYFGTFNGAIGVVTFAGTLLGGYLASGLGAMLPSWPLWLTLLPVYLLSFGGRTVGALLCLKIRDPTKYPESIDQVWRRFEHFLANAATEVSTQDRDHRPRGLTGAWCHHRQGERLAADKSHRP